MLKEILEYLRLSPGKKIVNTTVGMGGHSEKIVQAVVPGGGLIAIDRDEESLASTRQRLARFAEHCQFVHANFVDVESVLAGLGVHNIDGIIFDLGISSVQLEDSQRGFSFQKEGPLDMRMDRSSYISAYDLLNNLHEDEISELLWTFGEERWHNRIAHLIVQAREKEPIATTTQLADLAFRAIPRRYRHRYYRIHPATRTFQAVRIAVNRELENLENALAKAIGVLAPQGRICVISFHSLEDRIAKHSFRKHESEGLITIITQKPLTPSASEVELNPLSRSAKLRVAEKL